jgi:hypothetical protein
MKPKHYVSCSLHICIDNPAHSDRVCGALYSNI